MLTKRIVILIIGVGVMMAASGCAGKKYVNARVDPLAQRVGGLETESGRHGTAIEQLENDVSRADERAVSAGERADEADRRAMMAQQQATGASSSAAEAMSSAETALAGLDNLEERVDGINDYELVSRHTIIFELESSQLTPDAKKTLDKAADELLMDLPFKVEVRGFTDTTGNRSYNLALSERRAQSVVRYLTTKHNIPLHRIHTVGLGSEAPAADNETRSGREQNRRAELWVYTSEALPKSAWWR